MTARDWMVLEFDSAFCFHCVWLNRLMTVMHACVVLQSKIRCIKYSVYFSVFRLIVDDCNLFQDVFLVDTNKFCFVWVGKGANPTEKKSGLGYAHVCL